MRRLAFSLLLTAAASAQVPIHYARYPSLSPDGSRVVFEWCYDLFIASAEGGRAVALTTHHARDTRPRFTRDGQWILFDSNRAGATDVYKIPVTGGEPARLTWHGGNDSLYDVTPDGQGFVFGSSRHGPQKAVWGIPFVVGLNGGTATRLFRSSGGQVQLSPDGSKAAFIHKRSDWYWRGYKGGQAEDIWIWDRATDGYAKITDYAGPDTNPLWSADGQTIYFLTDRGGVYNLWRMPAGGGEAVPLTQHEANCREAAISADGRRIAYESDGDLWLLDTAGGPSRKLELTGPFDRLEPEIFTETRTDGIGEYAVAPSGKEAAFVIRGDIYVCRYPDGGPTRQVTNTAWEEGGPAWSEDSKTLYFHSDQHGQYDFYSVTSGVADEPRLRRTPTHTFARLTETPVDERGWTFSPDFKRVAFLRGYGDLVVAEPNLANPKQVGEIGQVGSIVWSPDSRWIAFDRDDEFSNQDVWICSADGGKAVNVSMHPGYDGQPAWFGDMSKLAFLSARDNDRGSDVYYVWLRHADWLRTQPMRDDSADDAFDKPKEEAKPPAPPAESQPAAPPAEAPQPPAPEPKRIDLDELHERLVQVTRGARAGQPICSPDGEKFGWTDDGVLQITGWEKLEPRPLPGVSPGSRAFEWSRDGKTIRYLNGGRLRTIGANGGGETAMSHSARIERKLAEERAYVFDKCWQLQRDLFYDPNLHGTDWNAAREFYRPRAVATPSREAFADVMNRMIGELRASHQGYSVPGRELTPTGPPTGDLGIVWSDDRADPGLLVESLEADCPAERSPDGPKPGERVLAIDGRPVEPATSDVNELLVGTIGRKVEVTVQAADGTKRTCLLWPASAGSISGARHGNWVKANRRWVAQASGGRIGYAHVPGMSPGGVSVFQRDLFASGSGKDGLLVDVRWNGGGGSFDFILESIRYREYTYNTSRANPAHGFPNGWLSVPVFRGKVAALHNEGSSSGAEIFGYGMSELGLGPVIGWPTWGGVIGTGGSTLVDGSNMRLPVVGYFTPGGLNMEGNPHQPDHLVDITPADQAAGRDPQLETAVRVLLEQMGPAR